MQSLLENIKPSLVQCFKPYHFNAIRVLDERDYTGMRQRLKKVLAKRGVAQAEEWYDGMTRAVQQYYFVAAVDWLNEHAVSEVVDDGWHADMLDSKGYDKFCNDLVGARMEHEPLDDGDQKEVAYVTRLYEFTMQRYDQIFIDVDRRFWPRDPQQAGIVCKHAWVESPKTKGHALFPAVAYARPQSVVHR